MMAVSIKAKNFNVLEVLKLSFINLFNLRGYLKNAGKFRFGFPPDAPATACRFFNWVSAYEKKQLNFSWQVEFGHDPLIQLFA